MSKSRGGLVCPLLAVILTFASGVAANAQQVFGNIYGTITDATGGAVAGAKVTITDTAKGTQFVVNSDASGNYAKGQLIPDPYTVQVESPGFQKIISSSIDVRVDDAARFDVSLKVGDAAKEVVEVTAAAPLLQTDRADVAQTFTTKEINDLPNIGRNTQSMELLNPGTAKIGWQHASDENPQGSVQMVTNGQLFDSMGYELDGTTNQDPILGIIVINPTFDSLAEMKQASQNFDAEFEYVGGGVASYSTKSGTNDLHGDVFEYLQLNTPGFSTFAANPFNNLPSATFRQNQFGGSIGGRLIKDKLFFFGDAQLDRETEGGSVVTSVPTLANRNGNFSDYLAYSPSLYTIYDPTTGNANGQNRTAYSGNIIPTSQLSKAALNLASYFPQPNFQLIPGNDFTDNYAINGAVNISKNAWDTREDYYVNTKNTIFGRYSDFAATEAAPGAFGTLAGGPSFGLYAGNSQASNRSLAIGWTDTLSPTVVNEFRFGYMRYHVFDTPNGYGQTPATDAGAVGLNLDKTYTSGMPYFDINAPNADYKLGYALGVNSCNCPLTQTESQYQFVDNLSKIMGKHTLKVGTDLRYAQNLRVPSDTHRSGELTFDSGYTGNVSGDVGSSPVGGVGLATFLLGETTSFGRYVSSSTNASESQPRFFFYGQDDYRVTSKLTLSYGMRWELVFPENVNATGNGATLNLSNGLMYVFGSNQVSSHGIQNMNWHNFAPRIGFAYQVDPKTVIRGGWGWGYDLGVFGSNFGHNVTQNPPVLENQQMTAPNAFSGVFNLAQGPAGYTGGGIQANGLPVQPTISADGTFPLANGINVKFRPSTVTLPQIYEYNATIQRQVTSKIAISGGYVGNSNRHGFLGTSNNINPNEALFVAGVSQTYLNRPYYSRYGWTQDLSYYCDCANEQYNSFQGTFKVSNLAGLTMQGSYTYQRQWGPGWGYDSNYYFLYDRSAGNGYSSTLPRQQWIFTETYDIPYGRGRKFGANSNKIVDAVAGGWTISGITTYYSGFPFEPTIDNYLGKPNVGPNNRPNIGTGAVYASNQSRAQWINGCTQSYDAATKTTYCSGGAFLSPSANTFGNYPINTLFGPHFIQQDMTFAKTFSLTEKLKFQLRMDAQNAFNHTNLGLPNSDVQSPSVGQITGLASGAVMRRLQFAGTIRF